MERAPGQPLENLVEESGPLELAKARVVLRNLLQAISYLHSKSVCHRDLKPDNIIVCPDTLNLKVIDFNVAVKQNFV